MLGLRTLLVSLLLAGALQAQSEPSLRRIARTERAGAAHSEQRALHAADGTRIGTWSATRSAVRLRPARGPEVLAPRLQHWLGSPDGRTLAGVGQPEALEHPFELELVVWRDGMRVAAPAERFSTESALTVGADGTVALVGHAPDRRGEPFALVLAADGALLYRHALPPGTLAREPRLFGQRLLVRTHGLFTEGSDGAIHALDSSGARLLCEAPGALVLVGFPAADAALVLTRDSARWIDARDGHERWQRALALRPAGEHAFALWRAPEREALALVTAGLPRAGEPGTRLWLLDARDGAVLERLELGPQLSPADVELSASTDGLVLERGDAREVFAWER